MISRPSSPASRRSTRIPNPVAGYRTGEIPFFAYLETNTAARRAALQDLGARMLRDYSSAPAVALALPDRWSDRSGTLGGGDIQRH